jgi:virulence-associated protein VapD
MSTSAPVSGIGHNSRTRGGRMYAIVFDLDTQVLQSVYPNSSWNNAYADIRNYLSSQGFDWMQGGAYFGNDTVDAVKCVIAVQRLSRKYAWFKPAVRDIRMLRIEENDDLLQAIDVSDAS